MAMIQWPNWRAGLTAAAVLAGLAVHTMYSATASEAGPATVRVQGRVLDAAGRQPLAARVYIQDRDGQWHFARSADPAGSAIEYRKQRPDGIGEMHTTLSAHPFEIELPPGEYTLVAERGKEYHPATQTFAVGDRPLELSIELERWIDMAELGWYSGETHVHRPAEELPTLLLAEDLNVAFPLTYWVTEAFKPPGGGSRGNAQGGRAKLVAVDPTHVFYPRNTEYEIFTVGDRQHTLGAFFVLNHTSVFDKGVPPVGAIARQAHREGGLIELDKHNWPWSMALVPIMPVDLYELANNHIWRTEFGYAQFGEPAADFMQVQTDERGFTERGWIEYGFANYYTLLDCGFRLRPTAGTATGVHPVPLGFGRVYVHLPNGFSYDEWLHGLNAGRSFVTTGPMLMVEFDGQQAGHTFQQDQAASRVYRISGRAVFDHPLRSIEIVVNGQVARTITPANDPTQRQACQSRIAAEIEIDATSWIAVRAFAELPDGRVRFAHTGPVHIDVAGRPLRPRAAEVEFLIQRVESQLQRSAGVLPEAALEEYREALRIYRQIAETAR